MSAIAYPLTFSRSKAPAKGQFKQHSPELSDIMFCLRVRLGSRLGIYSESGFRFCRMLRNVSESISNSRSLSNMQRRSSPVHVLGIFGLRRSGPSALAGCPVGRASSMPESCMPDVSARRSSVDAAQYVSERDAVFISSLWRCEGPKDLRLFCRTTQVKV